MTVPFGPSNVVQAVEARTVEVVERLRQLTDAELEAPSLLPGWSRLTIACHLRFGAVAFRRLTEGGIAGTATAYYPGGRTAERPLTLLPEPDERPADVIESLEAESARLLDLWNRMTHNEWQTVVHEPEDNPDLGPLPVSNIPLLRLTEIEVHGTDLDVGTTDWSELFVDRVLPLRLDWLNRRRTNHRSFDGRIHGQWLLRSPDGFAWSVAVEEGQVSSRAARDDDMSTATINGTKRDLLALLLGRPCLHELTYDRDANFGRRFSDAFPGP